MTYKDNGIEYMDIHDYANKIGRTLQAVRESVLNGNRVRKLRSKRVGRKLYIPVAEYYIYPYINSGKGTDRVYHYSLDNNLLLCDACTKGQRCTKINSEGEWNGQ